MYPQKASLCQVYIAEKARELYKIFNVKSFDNKNRHFGSGGLPKVQSFSLVCLPLMGLVRENYTRLRLDTAPGLSSHADGEKTS